MIRVAVVADESTALGWRLAGAQIYTPRESDVSQCLDRAAAEADLVLITAELAARLPGEQLAAAALRLRPLLEIIADVRGSAAPPDLEREVRRTLGVAT